MSNFLRTVIFEKVIRPLQNNDKIMSNLCLQFNKEPKIYCFTVPLSTKDYNFRNEVTNIANSDLGDIFSDIIVKENTVDFNIPRDKYIKQILEKNFFDVMPPLLINNNKNVIIEFSSPNIAKPFHVGHLRSTIIGNCIANLSSFLENQVTKINYLGDWGTQFGYIHLGMEMANINDITMQKDPIKTLYDVYVNANELAKSNPEINDRANEVFRQLELGDSVIYDNWQKIRNLTLLELEKTYERIGVVFDRYEWESMYATKNISKIINMMEEMQLLKLDSEKRKVVSISQEKDVPILKSDGSTLYISRDIAAAIDRFEKNKFDAMYYVVDNAQTEHFINLIEILNKMKLPWVNTLEHVKFGRINGMSTRQGTAVFVEEILDKVKEIMKDRQMSKKTTKVSSNKMHEVSDILAVSSVIIQDLKQKRTNNYTFDWATMLDANCNSGIRLQYTHCRLCSLVEMSGATLVTECDSSLLREPEVDYLITLIGQFDQVVLKCYEHLQPCILTIYLFYLCKAINQAIHKLNLKRVPKDLGNQRLLLFHVARLTLAQGMKLLGLTPLEKM